MNKMFGNIEFGTCENDNVRVSPYGLAVKNQSNAWVSYDSETREIIDVNVMNFDAGKFLFKMPVAFYAIAVGDIIIHNRKPVIVTAIEDKTRIVAIDVQAGEEKLVIPTTNMFGFNYVTKVVNLFGSFMGTPNPEQPFGNFLPFMLMSECGEAGSENLALAMMMMQGGAPANLDPMMMYFLMSDNKSSKDMLPFFLLSNQPGITLTPTETK